MNSSWRALIPALAASTALSGCAAQPAPPTPAPTPTEYRCTPESGGDQVPCTKTEHDQAQKRDALYAEAETVYRRFWNESQRLQTLPDPQVTPELEAVTGGAAREWLPSLVQGAAGKQRVSGESRLVRVKRLPGLSRSGSIVALDTCFDGSAARYNDPAGGPPVPGAIAEQSMFFGRVEGQLRIVDATYKDVESC